MDESEKVIKLENVVICDPPSGCRYGFPKELTIKEGQTYKDWLLEQGYPESLLEIADQHTRYWYKHEN